MKKKKLLSIGIVTLAITFTSIGAFAADGTLSAAQKAIMQKLVKTYYAGANPVNNLDFNKNTKISDMVNENSEIYQKIEKNLNSYDEGSVLVDSIKDGASISDILSSSLIYASLTEDNFNSYKAMTTEVTKVLMDIDKAIDPSERIAIEEKAAEIIDPAYGIMKFGKNNEGNTTLSLEKNNQIILQINTANANKLVAILNSFESFDEFKNFLTELGIK